MPQDIRLLPDALGRMLHNTIYQRIVNFCNQYTPEIPGEEVAKVWLQRFFNGDNDLHILVNLADNYTITSHSIIDVQKAFGQVIVFCHQVQSDKGSTGSIEIGMEYITKLAEQSGAYCIVMNSGNHSKALQKKFNFEVVRSVMIKRVGEGDVE